MKWACRKATAPSLCISQFASPATGCTPALRQGVPSRRIRNWRGGGEGAVGELTVCRLSGTNLCKVHSLGARQLHMKSCKPLSPDSFLYSSKCAIVQCQCALRPKAFVQWSGYQLVHGATPVVRLGLGKPCANLARRQHIFLRCSAPPPATGESAGIVRACAWNNLLLT